MRARRNHVVAHLGVAVAIVVAAFTAPTGTSVQADGSTPVCTNGSAWDDRLKRCV